MKILQLSDIHWTKRRSWNEDFSGMKSSFKKEMNDYRNAGGMIDYIFICGDIAFKGSKEEYDEARNYIKEICTIFDCDDKDVFIVPGNHDIDRRSEGSAVREILNAALSFQPSNNYFLDEVILKHPEMRKSLYGAFKEYYEFAKTYLCHEEVMGKCLDGEFKEITDDDKMYYHNTLAKKVGDIVVSIRGVNTALNCDSQDWNEGYSEGHKQLLPKRAYIMDRVNKQEIRIIMGHHPLEFLTNNDEVEDYLNKNYHIQLFGHVHVQNVMGDNYVKVLSGAFDPPKDKKNPNKYRPVFNIIELTPKDDTHITIKGTAQIWGTNSFVDYDEGCFKKDIEIDINDNKWKKKYKNEEELDLRTIKFHFLELDNRTSFFDKINGLVFSPLPSKSDYDNCLDFLEEVERQGKMGELKELIY